jgi:hypothetical protein
MMANIFHVIATECLSSVVVKALAFCAQHLGSNPAVDR